MSDFEELIKIGEQFHGHICVGIVIGTRLTMAGMRELGMDPMTHSRNLMVITEIDRCYTDAIQAITGCSLGRRSLKYKEYGKTAATFIDTRTGKAVRVTIKKPFTVDHSKMKELNEFYSRAKEEDILRIERVSIKDMGKMGSPVSNVPEICSVCSEGVRDNHHLIVDGKVMCKNCAEGSYYSVLKE